MSTGTTQPSTTYTLHQVAEKLGCSEMTIRRRIRDGSIPAIRLRGGQMIRIPAVFIDDLLINGTS